MQCMIPELTDTSIFQIFMISQFQFIKCQVKIKEFEFLRCQMKRDRYQCKYIQLTEPSTYALVIRLIISIIVRHFCGSGRFLHEVNKGLPLHFKDIGAFR